VSVAPVAQKTQYHPLKTLAPISLVSTIPQTVIVKKELPIKSMDELISYAKAHPGELKYGSSGAGGLMHYSVALFQVRTGTKMTHVPFKGGAPATAAVVSGEVDLSFTNLTDALPQMEAETVRGLAVTTLERSTFAPKLPTVAETGVKNFSAESWNAVIAPAGTPEPVIQRVATALQAMAKDPEVKKSDGRCRRDHGRQFPCRVQEEDSGRARPVDGAREGIQEEVTRKSARLPCRPAGEASHRPT
jgi:tripartite-type tricarboxylate transporter receptor subunit TctC